jgi:hypothetical protein
MKKSFWSLSIGKLANLAKRMIETSSKAAYSSLLKDLPLQTRVEEAATDFVAVVDKKTFSGHGKSVAEADVLRDSRFKGFKDLVTGQSLMDGLSTQQDALDILAIINQHGSDLYSYAYNDETTHLDQLIADLEKPFNAAKIQNVKLGEAFELVKAAEKAFTDLVGVQSAANSELRGKDSASAQYKTLANALSNYVAYVDAMTTIDSNWTPLALELNEAIKSVYNTKDTGKDSTETDTTAK